VLTAIVNGCHVPISDLRRDLPVELAAVVERCLETEPERRFQGGRQLTDALRRVEVGLGSSDVEQVTTKVFSVPSSSVAREQAIRFCETADGMRIAYSTIGTGPLLVRVLGFFTHLEIEWEWPDLRHLWERLAERYTVIRYDGRGIGLSDRFTGEFSEETRQLDLDAVLTAVGAEGQLCLAFLRVDGRRRLIPIIILNASAALFSTELIVVAPRQSLVTIPKKTGPS